MDGRQVLNIRKQLGLSQAKLGLRMRATANTVARWERGELGISGTAATLLELLDAHPELADELAESKRTAKK